MKQILQMEEGNEILRQNAEEVSVSEISSPLIQKVINEMSEALLSQEDGVALAAPQIGYALSIFVVSGKVFSLDFINDRDERMSGDKEKSSVKIIKKDMPKDLVFINPRISKLSRDKEWLPEGCLSVRWLYGEVKRSKKATITAYDENGKKFTRGASGLLAQIFQHETDHLKGVLFIDKAKEIRNDPPKV